MAQPDRPVRLQVLLKRYSPECVEGKLCELRLDGVLQQVAAQMTYQASWRHERIFRRPKREDRRSARARDGQEPSHPHLLRLALLRQTLRQTRRGGSLASPQEETRLKTQAR